MLTLNWLKDWLELKNPWEKKSGKEESLYEATGIIFPCSGRISQLIINGLP